MCVELPRWKPRLFWWLLLELPVCLAHREWLGREGLRYLAASLTNTNDNSNNRVVTTFTIFFYPSGLLFKFHCCLSLPYHGGISPLGGGIVGENRSTWSKTTVRSKRVGPLESKWGPFTWFPQWYLLLYLCALKFGLWHISVYNFVSQDQRWDP